ncbi:MAG: DUF1840 domain-containing protein [Gammaproteobacteria bacterium]
MLITFETKAYANITMFGDIAKKLIKFMGHSGTVPGAIKADDLPKALERLQIAVRTEMANGQEDKQEDEDESEAYVSIDKRAKPLIDLLKAAIERNTDVMWDE